MYPFNQKTNTVTIPMRLKTYADLYNPIDPSPAPTRDLSEEVVDYLVQCSDEIDLGYKLELSIEMLAVDRDDASERDCGKSIRSFFTHEIFVTNNRKNRNSRDALKHLLISLSCLSIWVISEQFNFGGVFFDIIKEAILIGGWVFMWESVTHNFIQIAPITEEIRRYQRIIDAPIHFRNAKPE